MLAVTALGFVVGSATFIGCAVGCRTIPGVWSGKRLRWPKAGLRLGRRRRYGGGDIVELDGHAGRLVDGLKSRPCRDCHWQCTDWMAPVCDQFCRVTRCEGFDGGRCRCVDCWRRARALEVPVGNGTMSRIEHQVNAAKRPVALVALRYEARSLEGNSRQEFLWGLTGVLAWCFWWRWVWPLDTRHHPAVGAPWRDDGADGRVPGRQSRAVGSMAEVPEDRDVGGPV